MFNPIRPVWLLFLLLLCTKAMAVTSTQNNSGDIKLAAWIGDEHSNQVQNFSVKQQVILTIEVATPRRFSKGTHIGLVEVANVIAKQRNQLAVNYTEKYKGQTWSIQRWEIVLYPLASGQVTIPPIPVQTQVANKDGVGIDITLFTPSLSFKAHLPSGVLSEQHDWLTASELSLEQRWQLSNEELKVGDSITRTITIKADDTLSILFPDLLVDSSNDNYQTYRKPIKLSDSSNRGVYQSKKVEQSVYVLQQGGEVNLPSTELIFWNSKKNQLETLHLEGKKVAVAHTLQSLINTYRLQLLSGSLFLSLLIVTIVYLRHCYQTHPKPLFIQLLLTIYNKQWGTARTLLYRGYRLLTGQKELLSAEEATQAWLQDAFKLQTGIEKPSLFLRICFKLHVSRYWPFKTLALNKTANIAPKDRRQSLFCSSLAD
jgi:hypothetical protein